jgi:hypothetical protein
MRHNSSPSNRCDVCDVESSYRRWGPADVDNCDLRHNCHETQMGGAFRTLLQARMRAKEGVARARRGGR